MHSFPLGRFVGSALTLIVCAGVACDSGGGGGGRGPSPSSASGGSDGSTGTLPGASPVSALTISHGPITDLGVPLDTIVADDPGQNTLPPYGDSSLTVADRGDAQYHLPIWVPPGRAGIQPSLSLDYSSGSGNGLVGTGWTLSGLSRITRCKGLRTNGAPGRPILWSDGDSYCLDGEELVPLDTDRVAYKKFHDDGSLIRHVGASTAADGTSVIEHFVVYGTDHRIQTFGATADSRVVVNRDLPAATTMTWAISRLEDRAGNFFTVSYAPALGGDILPHEIDYTGSATDPTTQRSVTFVYDSARPDIDDRLVGEQPFYYAERLIRFEMQAPNVAGLTPLRTFSLRYDTSATTGRSLLTHVAECDGPGPAGIPVTTPTPLCRQEAFNYAPGTLLSASNSFTRYALDSEQGQISDLAQSAVENVNPTLVVLDVDADGRDDILYISDDPNELYSLRLSVGTGFGPALNLGIPVAAQVNKTGPPPGPTAPVVLDFDGDGHPDILVNQGNETTNVAHIYLANDNGTQWTLGGAGHVLTLSADYSAYQSADLNGDGRPDLVMLQGPVGYYSLNVDGTLPNLTAPALVPNLTGATASGATYTAVLSNYFLDLNNDGVTEILTRSSTSATCTGNTHYESCNCDLMGYSAADLGATLYAPGYYNLTPASITGVQDLFVCQNVKASELKSLYTPLFGDFNGDGTVDAFQTYVTPPLDEDPNANPPMNAIVSFGSGDQTFYQGFGPGTTLTFPDPAALAFATLDADQDGKTDLLVRTTATLPYTVYSWKNRAWQATQLLLPDQPSVPLMTSADVNGDGLDDFIVYVQSVGLTLGVPTGQLVVYERATPQFQADLLTSVEGSFGPNASATYKPFLALNDGEDKRDDCSASLSCVTRSGWLADTLGTDDGIGGTHGQHFTYGSGRTDPLGWGFLGFKTHTITDDITGAITTQTFDLSVNTLGPTPFYPFLSLPQEVDTTITYQSNGQPVTRTSLTTFGRTAQGTGPYMALPMSQTSTTSDSNTPTLIASTFTRRTYDEFGNMKTELDTWPLDGVSQFTTMTYLNDTTNWFIGLPTDKVVTNGAGSESATREVAYTYDALGQLASQIDNPGAPDGDSYDPLPPQSDGVQTLYTTYARDTNGLPLTITKSDQLASPTVSRTTTYQYDLNEGMFVIQTTDPMYLVTRSAYEPGLGVVAAETDANGVETTYQYDTFGRIVADHPAAGGDRSVTYHGATGNDFGSIEDHRLGQYDTTRSLDSLRRTTKTSSVGRADGNTEVVDTEFDNLGRVQSISRPHFPGALAPKTVSTYDALNRVVQVVGADTSVVTTSYVANIVTTTNGDGDMTRATSDSEGRPLTSVQAITPGPAGLTGPVTLTTSTYGPFGVLESSTDDSGTTTRMYYDRVGRLLLKVDSDSGPRKLSYDVFGEKTDDLRGGSLVHLIQGGVNTPGVAGGVDTQTTYDDDGRVLTVSSPDVTQTTTWDTTYPGKVASRSLTGGTTINYGYDPSNGNLLTKSWQGPHGSLGFTYTYDTYNRLSTTTYPAYPTTPTSQTSLVVQNQYSGGDVGGELTAVVDVTNGASSTAYWRLTATDPSETFTSAALTNSVASSALEDTSHPGFLFSLSSTIGDKTVQALSYTRDGSGRIHERDDTLNGITEIFGYDGLERLTSWHWTGGAGPRGATYVFDDTGNLKQRQITAGPGTNVTYTYGTNGMGPHQVSSDGSATTFSYDAHGNQTGTPGRTLAFNSLDLPTRVTTPASQTATTMTYDGELARFSRTTPNGVTRYSYSPLYEVYSDAAGDHYVMTVSVGHPVAQVETVVKNNVVQPRTLSTLLVDALGSLDTIVTNGTVQSVKYDPFGAQVQAVDPLQLFSAPPQDSRIGFTGHMQDEDVNLVDMIGRIYDPLQQRFLSEDPPAPSATDGQGWNPYAYVRNNPLNATDPTGYIAYNIGGVTPVTIHDPGGGLSIPFDNRGNTDIPFGDWFSPIPKTPPVAYGAQAGQTQGQTAQAGPASAKTAAPVATAAASETPAPDGSNYGGPTPSPGLGHYSTQLKVDWVSLAPPGYAAVIQAMVTSGTIDFIQITGFNAEWRQVEGYSGVSLVQKLSQDPQVCRDGLEEGGHWLVERIKEFLWIDPNGPIDVFRRVVSRNTPGEHYTIESDDLTKVHIDNTSPVLGGGGGLCIPDPYYLPQHIRQDRFKNYESSFAGPPGWESGGKHSWDNMF